MNSNPPKRGLGRGLEALLTEQPSTASVSVSSAKIKVSEIGLPNAINELILEAQTLKSMLEDLESWFETMDAPNNH